MLPSSYATYQTIFLGTILNGDKKALFIMKIKMPGFSRVGNNFYSDHCSVCALVVPVITEEQTWLMERLKTRGRREGEKYKNPTKHR